MKHISIFESNYDDIAAKSILDKLTFLWDFGIIGESDIEIDDSYQNPWPYTLKTDFGNVGFSEEYDVIYHEYTGEGSWDLILQFERNINGTKYLVLIDAYAKRIDDEWDILGLSNVKKLVKIIN